MDIATRTRQRMPALCLTNAGTARHETSFLLVWSR
jgi:hypothetical protein